ncbi:thiamine diphosphokinase [Hazenella sp. IB182353]|uniref:thiamine diphosphokinase n=1 Tax=Polycladospora coralii TaxID=2771432 RepID=UPI001746048E|nr:thiamine diphosphokinase [Polycladospora coralii]MBS7530354.1 thiamine diphosphokinase [Polycladospora coralii]
MKHERVIVVTGGEVTPACIQEITTTDFVIGVDGGAQTCLDFGIIPHLAVGDFDTAGEASLKELKRHKCVIESLNQAKNVTDTHYALTKVVEMHPSSCLLLGALGGTRYDHLLANLGLLEGMEEAGIATTILHPNNRIRLLSGPGAFTFTRSKYVYFSIQPITPKVEGLTTKGLRYPLIDECLYRGETRGVSNEWLSDVAQVILKSGKCFIIESKDE